MIPNPDRGTIANLVCRCGIGKISGPAGELCCSSQEHKQSIYIRDKRGERSIMPSDFTDVESRKILCERAVACLLLRIQTMKITNGEGISQRWKRRYCTEQVGRYRPVGSNDEALYSRIWAQTLWMIAQVWLLPVDYMRLVRILFG